MRDSSAPMSHNIGPLSLANSACSKVAKMRMFDESEDEIFMALFVIAGALVAGVLAMPVLAAGGLWHLAHSLITAPRRFVRKLRGHRDEADASSASAQILEFSPSRGAAQQPPREIPHTQRRAA